MNYALVSAVLFWTMLMLFIHDAILNFQIILVNHEDSVHVINSVRNVTPFVSFCNRHCSFTAAWKMFFRTKIQRIIDRKYLKKLKVVSGSYNLMILTKYNNADSTKFWIAFSWKLLEIHCYIVLNDEAGHCKLI